MKHRTAARIVTWALVATAACGHDATGPSAPTCSAALASQLTLAVGAYASIDPLADGGCVTFPANTSGRAPAVAASTPRASPPAVGTLRSFVVCAKLDCSQFKTVGARAQAVGAHVAIYIDALAPTPGLDSADVDTLKQVFDARL